MERTHVIVGAGLAGATAAMTMRTRGFDGRVIVIGDENHPPYSRPPLSKQFIRGQFGLDRVHLRPPAVWEKHDVQFILGRACVAVDVAAHQVTLEDGETIGYDSLLLATGGRARTLPGQHVDAGVYALRTIDDAVAIREHLGPGRRLLMVGAGFVGAELAASAAMMDTDVTVLEAASAPLGRALPASLGEVYGRMHQAHGVDIRVNATVDRVETDGSEVCTTLSDGQRYHSDAVVVAIGSIPDVALARDAGLDVGDGVIVDEYCRTSAPQVYAVGDIANHPNPLLRQRIRVEHWQNAQHQSQVAAANMAAGASDALQVHAEVPWVWSDQYDVNLQVAGRPLPTDEVVFRGDPTSPSFSAMLLRHNVLVAAVAINRSDDVRAARALIARRVRPDPSALRDPSSDLTDIAQAAD